MTLRTLRPAAAPESDDRSYIWVAMVICFLAWVVIKEIIIPRPIMIAMAAMAGLFLLFKGSQKPELVTYALVAYLPFSRELVGDFGGLAMAFNFTNILIAFILWVWFTGRYAQGESMWISTSLNVPIFVFILIGFISICRGSYLDVGDIGVVIINYKRWITPIILYFLVLNTVKDRITIRNVGIIIMIATTVAALMAIYDYIDKGDVGSMEKSRIGGIAEQPNQLAAFFNYYMFLPLGFFITNMSKAHYWWLLVPFLLCFRGIMVTFSRGGYLSFVSGIYSLTFFRSKILLMLLVLFSYVIYLNPWIIPHGIRYRMGQTVKEQPAGEAPAGLSEANIDTSSRRRVEVWRAGLDMIKDNPVFGVGYGLFPYMVKYYWDGGEMDSHNTYIILAAEMGLPALAVFLWIILLIFWNTAALYYKTKDPFAKALALGWLGGLGGLLLSNMFGSRLDSQEISGYLWILSALIMRLKILDAREGEAAIPVRKIGYGKK